MRRILLTLLISLVTFSIACGGGNAKKDEQPTEQTEEEYAKAMGEEHKDDSPEASPQAEEKPDVEVETTKITYHTAADGREIKGFLTKPKGAEGSMPAVIVIHEWWGLNNNIKSMSEQLAAKGYMTLAVDLYQGKMADNPDKAMELMKTAMESPDKAKANLRSAYATLKKNGATKIGVIGWCFGGAWSLQTALMFPDKIAATVIYYGRLVQDKEKLATLNMPILGIFGAKDSGIPVAGVKQFEKTLKELDKDASIHIYADAQHAFANPSGEAYDKTAAEDAWKRTVKFLAENLKGEGAADAAATDAAAADATDADATDAAEAK